MKTWEDILQTAKRPDAVLSDTWKAKNALAAIEPLAEKALVFVRGWLEEQGEVWRVAEKHEIVPHLRKVVEEEERDDELLAEVLKALRPMRSIDLVGRARTVVAGFRGVVVDRGHPFLVEHHDTDVLRGGPVIYEILSGGDIPHRIVVPPKDDRAPSLDAYGYVRAATSAEVKREMKVEVGIHAILEAGTAASPMRLPEGSYEIDVTVTAPGFAKRTEDSWRHTIQLVDGEPAPGLEMHLTPNDVGPLTIRATYAIGGRVVGHAERFVEVLGGATTPVIALAPGAVTLAPPDGGADLTIEIAYRGDTLTWNLYSPHGHIDAALRDRAAFPEEGRATSRLRSDPTSFQALLLELVPVTAHEALSATLRGLGGVVSNAVPKAVLDVLDLLDRPHDAASSILIVTDEPAIPWELAWLGPPTDAGAFLGARFAVGRWPLGSRDPKMPPPRAIRRHDMNVLLGKYEQLPPLEHSEREADDLVGDFGANKLEASWENLTATLGGRVAAIHYAGHATHDGGGANQVIQLQDDQLLNPFFVRAQDLQHEPLVFLNACQAAPGAPLLAAFSGFPDAFLAAGAAAVVAPLWHVNDRIARDVALGFYRMLKDEDETAGEALRRLRSAEGADPTVLAYQLFGDPTATWVA